MAVRGPSHIRDRHRRTIAQDQPPCHICGMPIDYDLPADDEMSYVVDHVVPLKLGGADDLANKAASHRLCNARKGGKDHAPIIRRSGALVTPGGGTPRGVA